MPVSGKYFLQAVVQEEVYNIEEDHDLYTGQMLHLFHPSGSFVNFMKIPFVALS